VNRLSLPFEAVEGQASIADAHVLV
jgi:hypothetical protein